MVTRNKYEEEERISFFLNMGNYWDGRSKEDCEVYSLTQREGVGGNLGSDDLAKGKAPDFSKYNHGIKRFLKLERALEIIYCSLFILSEGKWGQGKYVTQSRAVVTQSRTVSRLWQEFSCTHVFSHQLVWPASLSFLTSSLDSQSQTLDWGPQPICSQIKQNRKIRWNFSKS